jgi:hypothetical protein
MDVSNYVSEPVLYPSLRVFDVTQEAASISTEYRNVVLNRINGGCLRLAVMSGEYPWSSIPYSSGAFHWNTAMRPAPRGDRLQSDAGNRLPFLGN